MRSLSRSTNLPDYINVYSFVKTIIKGWGGGLGIQLYLFIQKQILRNGIRFKYNKISRFLDFFFLKRNSHQER